jgi:putative ABC transport system permease protein
MESDSVPLTVVGVVGNVNHEGLVESDLPQMYLPCAQNPSSIMNLLVRTIGEPMSITEAVRHEICMADKDQPVFDAKTMEAVLAESFSELRIFSSLITIFATLALLLAAIGVYGVISYSVTERAHEIGVRMALGAQQKNIIKMIFGQCLTLVVILFHGAKEAIC